MEHMTRERHCCFPSGRAVSQSHTLLTTPFLADGAILKAQNCYPRTVAYECHFTSLNYDDLKFPLSGYNKYEKYDEISLRTS
jgi:hypothetical protein